MHGSHLGLHRRCLTPPMTQKSAVRAIFSLRSLSCNQTTMKTIPSRLVKKIKTISFCGTPVCLWCSHTDTDTHAHTDTHHKHTHHKHTQALLIGKLLFGLFCFEKVKLPDGGGGRLLRGTTPVCPIFFFFL